MKLSNSSKPTSDPLSDVLGVLGGKVTRQTRLEAGGCWAFSFPAIERLKFVAILRGTLWMLLPDRPPKRLDKGDVCLLGRTSYAVASDLDAIPGDGEALYASGRDLARVGGDDTIGIGGTVTFSGDATFLLDMLPGFMVVPRFSPGSDTIATILRLIAGEAEGDAMGNAIVRERLADILLVEAIRAYAMSDQQVGTGWLGAITDLRIGRALQAMHADVAHGWTVVELASIAGMSRAAFAAEFSRRVGQPPLTYLRIWRLTLARSALHRGDASIARVAADLGYTSLSAFGHAYRRMFAMSPRSARQPDAASGAP